jgi:predicted unusual protein kinase regulating ubiquinone biosynthesis (AarF/ABC1/UbiB family)
MGQDKIAVSRLGRAGKLVNTGAKVGGNYMKYYAKRLLKETSREELEEDNARDIYEAFSELKGGPLKVAQMLSMGDQVLPKSFVDQFSRAQNNVDPLSYPLVRKMFRQAFDQYPEDLFDSFSKEAVNAASIGQVHQGVIDGQKYAIKIQYPGVADSLKSDLRLISPVASRILGLKKSEIAPYLEEVELKLIEETDYHRELQNSKVIIEGCKQLNNLEFPEFINDLSNDRVITMSWMEGEPLSEWLKSNPDQAERDKIGQSLWNFYQHQIHKLKFMHADPHPGNFIITKAGKLGVIDFGCVKELPDEFYNAYMDLLKSGEKDVQSADFVKALYKLDLLSENDKLNAKELILSTFQRMFQLVGKPFFSETFDFSNDAYFQSIFEQGESLSKDPALRGLTARGSRHFIYFNRTYFGLYQLLNKIGAKVKTGLVDPR